MSERRDPGPRSRRRSARSSGRRRSRTRSRGRSRASRSTGSPGSSTTGASSRRSTARRPTTPEARASRRIFEGVPVAQMNYTIVDVENHIKGLHYHLKQQDVWYCPHPSKAKFVLFDVQEGLADLPADAGPRRGRRAGPPREDPGRRRPRLPAAHEPLRPLLHRDADVRRERSRRVPDPLGPPGRPRPVGNSERLSPAHAPGAAGSQEKRWNG